ncbi:Mo-dependent nitrogenase C-terminal domain-containing protein [Synechococcus sp. H55.7]|uniref:Mo-dependent nitrogenase C-terminal domain-containing protein n=1 Tax=unclassified Synechococcus TaxID=2626047 RepID=UPI0039C4192D
MTSTYFKPAAHLHDWLQAPLQPIRAAIDSIEVGDPRLAHFLCRWIPARCPFERDVVLLGHKIMHIPPMCKLNPFYDQVVGLRFRALSFLAEQGEDISRYL